MILQQKQQDKHAKTAWDRASTLHTWRPCSQTNDQTQIDEILCQENPDNKWAGPAIHCTQIMFEILDKTCILI